MTALQVAVVGGGIGGAAAARALLQRGFDVELFEQAARLAEVGAGVAVAPNGVRMLKRLGCGAAVDRWGSRWTDTAFCRPDGEIVAPILLPEADGRPVEYYGFHRADLLGMLLDGIPPRRLHPGHRCVGFAQDDRRATVEFENGTQVTSDVVVAADGIHSALQPFVVPPAKPIHSGSSASRGTIACSSIGWPAGKARLWMGEGKHFLVVPIRDNQLVNYVGFVPTNEEMRESWSAPGDPQDLAEVFAGWDPVISTVIEQIGTTFTWGLYDREPLPRWTNGRLTLLGDAAHPMLPHQGQGANQAIEDAVALATLLEHFGDDPTAALITYEQVRQVRTARVQRLSRRGGANYDAKVEDQEARDHELKQQAAERAWIFGYDAEAEALAAAGTGAVRGGTIPPQS
jgi:salicylate hydroxylase